MNASFSGSRACSIFSPAIASTIEHLSIVAIPIAATRLLWLSCIHGHHHRGPLLWLAASDGARPDVLAESAIAEARHSAAIGLRCDAVGMSVDARHHRHCVGAIATSNQAALILLEVLPVVAAREPGCISHAYKTVIASGQPARDCVARHVSCIRTSRKRGRRSGDARSRTYLAPIGRRDAILPDALQAFNGNRRGDIAASNSLHDVRRHVPVEGNRCTFACCIGGGGQWCIGGRSGPAAIVERNAFGLQFDFRQRLRHCRAERKNAEQHNKPEHEVPYLIHPCYRRS